MNIHEYQARELLSSAGVAVPRGAVARTPEEADSFRVFISSKPRRRSAMSPPGCWEIS